MAKLAPMSSGTRRCSRGSRDSIPTLKDEVDGDLFMHGSGEFAYAFPENGLIDEYEGYLNPLVWGKGNVHVLGDRGTVRMELDDVKRFNSGVVLLTYLPKSWPRACRSTKRLLKGYDRVWQDEKAAPSGSGVGSRFEVVGELPRTTGGLQARTGRNRDYGYCGLRSTITTEVLETLCSLRFPVVMASPFRK